MAESDLERRKRIQVQENLDTISRAARFMAAAEAELRKARKTLGRVRVARRTPEHRTLRHMLQQLAQGETALRQVRRGPQMSFSDDDVEDTDSSIENVDLEA